MLPSDRFCYAFPLSPGTVWPRRPAFPGGRLRVVPLRCAYLHHLSVCGGRGPSPSFLRFSPPWGTRKLLPPRLDSPFPGRFTWPRRILRTGFPRCARRGNVFMLGMYWHGYGKRGPSFSGRCHGFVSERPGRAMAGWIEICCAHVPDTSVMDV